MRNFLFRVMLIAFAVIYIPGCERPMAKPIIDAVTPMDLPTMDNPETFAVAFVQAAIDLYKTEGREAAIAYYNDPASMDGQWYVFITDENDLFVSHAPMPDLLRTDNKTFTGPDGMTGVEIAMATEAGRWTEYLWPNPGHYFHISHENRT